MDYISAHRYSENNRRDSAWFLAEGVAIDRVLDDYAGLLAYLRGAKRSQKSIYVSFDEWNVWYKNMEMDGHGSSALHLIEEVYNLEDALVCAQYLNSFIRHADLVKITCIAQIANVIAPILTRFDGPLRQAIYYPFQLYSQAIQSAPTGSPIALTPVIATPTYAAGERGDVPALDATASFDESTGALTIFLINRGQDDELAVEIALADRRVTGQPEARILGGGDVKAANTWVDPQRIVPTTGPASVTDTGDLRVAVPAPGLAVVRATLAPR